jgi:hypothetical protein
MGLREEYEVRKAATKRRQDEQKSIWRRKADPVSHFTKWLAGFTGALVLVAFLQWWTLENTDRTTREALIVANRAWISPVRAELVTGVDDPEGPTVMVHYQNVGRTPALDVRVGMGPVAVDVDRPVSMSREYPQTPLWDGLASTFKETCNKNETISGMGAVYPSATTEGNVPSRMTTGWSKDKLLKGTQIIVVTSCFTYRTMEQVHHSGSCSFFFHQDGKPAQNWEDRSCPTGNFAD